MSPWKSFALAVVSLAVSSCNKIEMKDIPLHWDAGSQGAVVTHLMSDESHDIPKAEWDQQRFGYVCISQPDYGWVKATIEKACAVAKICSAEEKKMVSQFFQRADRGAHKVKSLRVGEK